MTDRESTEVTGGTWLQDLLRVYARRPTPRAPQSPSPGELWYASGDAGVRRILLLLAIDHERGLARAAIASTEPEVATDASLVFSADELGTPFDVVIETDLVMPVWLRQLGPYLGRVPISIDSVQRAADTGIFAVELEARRGMPLHGPHDTRVATRDQELEDLWEIAGDCVAEIEAWDAEQAICDPRLLTAASDSDRNYTAVVAILDARRRGASVGPWTHLRLRQRWQGNQVTRKSPDLTAAFGRLENDILVALEGTTSPPVRDIEWAPASLATDPFDRELIDSALAEALERGARAVDFFTVTSLVPSRLRESPGLVATLGARSCAVTICT
jgi:hypothetical protein